MRTARLLALVPIVSLVFAAPAGANHDPDVGNRTRHVQAHPCWADMKILESPGEQTLTGPGGPNVRDVTRITGSSGGGCSFPTDYIRWTSTFSGPSGTCATGVRYGDGPGPWGGLTCPIDNPVMGTYSLTLTATIHPYLDPMEEGCVKDVGPDGVYKTCSWTIETFVVDLPI